MSPATRDADDPPTHEAINKAGGKASFVKADVSVEADVAALVQEAVTRHDRLDIMINNAGIAIESKKSASIWDVDVADYDLTQKVNARGVFLGCKYASKIMKDQEPGPTGDRGWIVNTASVLALVSTAHTGELLHSIMVFAIDLADEFSRVLCEQTCGGGHH